MPEQSMFEVDVAGLRELEGGKPPQRLALEPIANVFDEFRGYMEDRKRPSYCAVTLAHQNNPRGVMLIVADDGPGFHDEKDVYTLFGSTAKRGVVSVAGRFNMGDKQLIAMSRWARVRTSGVTVVFEDGKREVTRHRTEHLPGTIVEALMPWNANQLAAIREQLLAVLPPAGLAYTVDKMPVDRTPPKCAVQVTLPTAKLQDGFMSPTTSKTAVTVLKTAKPTLFELGMPVCDLSEMGFPWSLDVQQKVPVPPSRDTVSPAYMLRLMGTVLEQATMKGIMLLSEEVKGAPFVKCALDWVREPAALNELVEAIHGKEPKRMSSNRDSNVKAVQNGDNIVPKGSLSRETIERLTQFGVLPTTDEVHGEEADEASPKLNVVVTCPHCGGRLSK